MTDQELRMLSAAIQSQLADAAVPDGEILRRVQEVPELLGAKLPSSANLFLAAVSWDRFGLAKAVAAMGADIHWRCEASGIGGNALNAACTPEQAEELLSRVRLPGWGPRRVESFSGGERQRIAIARAILNEPRLLILDEATASLDTESEFMIQKALERLTEGRTTFAIAHRLSTLQNADRLIVIDGHQVAEVGSHEELIRKGGIYYRLVKAQLEMQA